MRGEGIGDQRARVGDCKRVSHRRPVQFGEKAIRGQFRDELVLDHRHVIDAAAADGVHRLLSGPVGPVHDLDAGFGGERL